MTQDLEQGLQSQPLREPPADLDQWVADLLNNDAAENAPSQITFPRSRRPWAAWAAVAALVLLGGVLLSLNLPWTAPPPGTDPASIAGGPIRFEPVRFDQQWSTFDAGDVVRWPDRSPVQPVVHRQIQQTRWVDDKRNIQIELLVPRHDIHLLPVRID
ncbi:MAG: hypothetical protein OER86_10855 [Phycisphaerae bacterium]|nr:hypothetical protein [Phycisphaerae bacterium]